MSERTTPYWDADDGPLIFLAFFVGVPWAVGVVTIFAGVGWLVLNV
jgi:hypothetical protein